MALSVRGVDVLTHPEFTELMRGLDPDAVDQTGVLFAWLHGEEISPDLLYAVLNVVCRGEVVDPRAEELIDRCCAQLEPMLD